VTNNQKVAAALIIGLAAGVGGGLVADSLTQDSTEQLLATPLPGTWPDVEWPVGSGQMVRAKLDEIRNWAAAEQVGLDLADPEQKTLNDECQRAIDRANDCQNTHTSTKVEHCILIDFAHDYANTAQSSSVLPDKIANWSKCADELDHSDP